MPPKSAKFLPRGKEIITRKKQSINKVAAATVRVAVARVVTVKVRQAVIRVRVVVVRAAIQNGVRCVRVVRIGRVCVIIPYYLIDIVFMFSGESSPAPPLGF